LLARERTGEGQHVRLSMLDAVVGFLWGSDMGSQTFIGDELPQQRAASFIDLIYETADGHISVAVQSDREWAALTRALDQPEWLDDARFKTVALRQDNINDRLAMTQEVLLTRTAAEWIERLEAEDVPCAPVLTRNGVLDHDQVRENGLIVEIDHPVAGPIRQARPAARFSATEAAIRHGAPQLGEHTVDLLTELGYGAADIEALREEGTIAGPAEALAS
ncbi:MAG: CoA transferase, partial [Hyphomicrobiales bacterium]